MVMPMAAMVVNMLLPPALINGRALPVKGIKPTITAKFIKASITIQLIKPKANKLPA